MKTLFWILACIAITAFWWLIWKPLGEMLAVFFIVVAIASLIVWIEGRRDQRVLNNHRIEMEAQERQRKAFRVQRYKSRMDGR